MKTPTKTTNSIQPKLKISTDLGSKIKLIVASAVAIWLIPFLVSIPMFNSNKELIINFFLFKAIMVIILAVVTWFSYNRLSGGNFFFQNNNALKVSGILVLTQVVLDLIILVGLFGTKIDMWAMTILPVYLIIPIIYFYRSSRETIQA
jgi:hypothetical protein